MRTKKFLASVASLAAASLVTGAVFAMPNLTPAETQFGTQVVVPAHAIELAPGLFSLGTAVDVTGKTVEGYMVFGHKPQHNPPGGGGGGGGNGGEKCFALLARGAKWKTTEDYLVDPTNSDGLSDTFVKDSIAAAVEVWDTEVVTDVFGTEVAGVVDGADTVSPDNKNEVLFADISSPGALAVAIVWGIFSGPPGGRELVEWDIVFDDVDFDWGDAVPPSGIFDLLNVAVHEVGHAGGLGHPGDTCTEESMYRFAALDETKKRDLNAGDIDGFNDLY